MAVTIALYSDLKARNRPSFYAPPLAWAVTQFTRSLIDDAGAIAPHHTGLIVVSDECSLSTIRELSRTAEHGSISPLRFAGASPSIVAGLPALEHGLRGPTMTLTMQPAHASEAMIAMIDYWLRYCRIVSVIAVAHHIQGGRHHVFKGFVAKSTGVELRGHVLQLTDPRPGELE